MFRFQISPTTSFNIGLYGKNEGGEHTQKIVKEHSYKWTNKKRRWMLSLVNQHIEVYVGGLYLFPDYSPSAMDLGKESTRSWEIRFGTIKHSVLDCSCCTHVCNSCGFVPEENILHVECAHTTLKEAVNSSWLTCFPFTYEQMLPCLSQAYSYSAHPTLSLLHLFARIDFDKFHCTECVLMTQVLFAAQFKKLEQLPWAQMF